MAGKVYGVGVGPGDPELMTLKAARVIREADVVAVPGKEPREALAYRIAVQAVPELAGKELLAVPAPMTRDREAIAASYRAAAAEVAPILEAGRSVAFITIGDPMVYSTFWYLAEELAALGHQAEFVSGVPSFCAAAARAGVQLTKWDEPLHVVPASHRLGESLDLPGTYVLMKAASRMRETKELLRASARDVAAVENCGLPEEHVYRGVDEIPDDAGYFALVIARER